MAKPEATWINLSLADLDADQQEAHAIMLEARKAFEATFSPAAGKALRFAYKGDGWDRIGVCEFDAPKSKDAVKQNLAAWLAARRASGDRT